MTTRLQSIICPACRIRPMTQPKASTGWRTPTNIGRFYQRCTANTFAPDAECHGFLWRDDIERAPQIQPTHPNVTNMLSLGGSCNESSNQALVPSTYTSTNVQVPFGAQVNCSGPNCSGKERPGHLNQQCTNLACKACCNSLSASLGTICKVSKHRDNIRAKSVNTQNVPVSEVVPVCRTQSQDLRNSVTEAVHASADVSLRENDFEYNDEALIRQHQDQYQRESKVPIKVKWWYKDGAEPYVFSVPAPGNYYHPRDCKTVTSIIGAANCEIFWVYDTKIRTWSMTKMPQRVKVGSILYFRSKDVMVYDMGGVVDTGLTVFESVTSNENPTAQPTAAAASTVPGSALHKFPTVPTSQTLYLDATHNNSNDGLIPSPTSSAHSSPTKQARIKWPLQYTCDMSQGFNEMDLLKTRKLNLPERFELAFDCPYVRSTYSDNRKVWDSIPDDVRIQSVTAGRTKDGRWKLLVDMYRKQKQSLN